MARKIASALVDETIRLWDGRTGIDVATLKGHSGVVTCANFSADGSRLHHPQIILSSGGAAEQLHC